MRYIAPIVGLAVALILYPVATAIRSATMAPRRRQSRAGSEVHTCARPKAWFNQRRDTIEPPALTTKRHDFNPRSNMISTM
jgi:hypothetical protein